MFFEKIFKKDDEKIKKVSICLDDLVNPKPLFQDPKTHKPRVLENVLDEYYKSRLDSIRRLSDSDVLSKKNSELIQRTQPKEPLATIYFFEPSSRSLTDSNVEIHIPFSGTASIFFGCPENELKVRPQLMAKIYDIPNAATYCAPSNIWQGPFVRHGEELISPAFALFYDGAELKDHVLVLDFEGDQTSQINPTIQTIKSFIGKSNAVIQSYEDKWASILEEKIESRREKIIQKQARLSSFGFKTQVLIDTEDLAVTKTPHQQLVQTFQDLLKSKSKMAASKRSERASLRIQSTIDTPSKIKQAARKLATQEKYYAWQKEYLKLKKSKPSHPDTWYAKQISKMDIAKGASHETIRKNMKK